VRIATGIMELASFKHLHCRGVGKLADLSKYAYGSPLLISAKLFCAFIRYAFKNPAHRTLKVVSCCLSPVMAKKHMFKSTEVH
jgi:hypothetical protein